MKTKVQKTKAEVSLVTEPLESPIYLPDVSAKIAEQAYYKAESRGFSPGHELDDWLEAERENNAA